MYSFLINYFCYSYHNKIYLFHFILQKKNDILYKYLWNSKKFI